ncbi:EF hand domain-containing protein [Cyclospora cayetanensis]|uniref:EF hand domain-containing protein n=1 Tax=Cyclospora cayetanensis TaxID=88456 RepID=A0A1D3CVI8_9EIME|nr:EF hand domain-containing protein [Cyclospora cayetanensis]
MLNGLQNGDSYRELRCLCSLHTALTPHHRVARSLLLARDYPTEWSSVGPPLKQGYLKQEGRLTSEATEALAFVLEGELDAAWSHQRRQQLLLRHRDITPEAAFRYLDKDGIGIVSKGAFAKPDSLNVNAASFLAAAVRASRGWITATGSGIGPGDIGSCGHTIASSVLTVGRLLQLLRQHRQRATLQLVEAFFWRFDRDRDGYLSLTDFLHLLYPRPCVSRIWARHIGCNRVLQHPHRQQQQTKPSEDPQQPSRREAETPVSQPLEGPQLPKGSAEKTSAKMEGRGQLARPVGPLDQISCRIPVPLPSAEEATFQLKWEREQRQREMHAGMTAQESVDRVPLRPEGDPLVTPRASIPPSLRVGRRQLSPQALAAAFELLLAVLRETEAARRDFAYTKGVNVRAVWRVLDPKSLGYASVSEVKGFLEDYGLTATTRIVRKVIQRYQRDAKLSFASFCDIMLPAGLPVSSRLKLQAAEASQALSLRALHLMAETELKLEGLQELFSEMDISAAFQKIKLPWIPLAVQAFFSVCVLLRVLTVFRDNEGLPGEVASKLWSSREAEAPLLAARLLPQCLRRLPRDGYEHEEVTAPRWALKRRTPSVAAPLPGAALAATA